VQLPAGTTLLAYTDGVTDARGEGGERFGMERLRATLAPMCTASAAELIAGLANGLADFQAGALSDDTAAIALRRR
jgi:sigma-B regulation protein RsbU (phosphoserine phosphatase)